MKRYQIKIYAIWNLSVPKKTFTFISWNKEALTLKNDFRFDGNKNNGQWALRLSFNKPFNNWDIETGDVIRISSYDEDNLNWEEIYSGFIDNLKRRADQEGQSIEITAFWLATLMNRLFVGWGPNVPQIRAFDDDPSNIITEILNQFNAAYSQPLINFDPIPLFWSNIQFNVEFTSCLEALQQIHEITGRIFYIDWSGTFFTQPRWTIPDHIFTLKKTLNILEQNKDKENVVNRVGIKVTNAVVTWVIDQDNPPNLIQETRFFPAYFTFDNLPNQAVNGVLEGFVDSQLQISEWVLSQAVIDFANEYLDEHAEPKNFLRLEVNDNYDILSIKPGDLVRIKNIDFTIPDAVIEKISYSSTGLAIDCEKTLDFWREVVND